ncbi:hypothetical protein Calow_0268 [Caldicellulosiruptor owensensis OL]|uniref:Uncharacterized protein n=1 Tax=Caldicellulosiruptor owensensis (strain ATCC 700167 / DSM 13100 / OL) TaxID=632518 RepID=E4Q333_CALOW|nr:hypothetical protein Calow_0268 [Caldicellulosiruptor owensensis OL]
MNDEKLDRIFEEAFKAEYRKEFKQELMDTLLKEYDKRKRKKFFLKISTMIAACIVLALATFGTVKFDLIGLNVRNTSVVKTEVEKAFPKQEEVTEQKIEQNNKDVNEDDSSSLYTLHVILKDDESSEKKEKQDLQKNQNSSNNISESQENFDILSKSDFPKYKEKVSKEVSKAGSDNSNYNEDVTSRTASVGNNSLPSFSTREVIKDEENEKVQGNIKSTSEQTEKNTLAVSMIELEKKQAVKVNRDFPEKIQKESVFKNVYILKEEKMKIDKKSILDILVRIVSTEVYAKKYFSSNDFAEVHVQVYDEYFDFEVVRNSIQGSSYQLPEEKESILESVYAKTELVLKEIGIKDYMISAVPTKNGYKAEISLCFDNYKVYGLDGYIEYSKKADIVRGKIYIKIFSKLKTIRIMDEKTAAKEFEKKYNFKNVKPSDICVVYKKTQDIYFPTYVYIHENKIYWLEK